MAGSQRGRHRQLRPRWPLLIGRGIAGMVALAVFAATGMEWSITQQADAGLTAHRVSALVPRASSSEAAPAAPAAAPAIAALPPSSRTYAPENILLAGSDSRAGAANAQLGGTDSSTTDIANSDVVMVVHLPADRRNISVVSIPRDTMVPAPTTCHEWNSATNTYSSELYQPAPGQRFHFNSGYSLGGPQCLVTEVQNLTGLHIDRFIGIDFNGFQSMVDALGGVSVTACGPIVDTVLNTVIATPGTQKINGATALNLVRARHVIGDQLSDLARIQRQQVVLSAILRRVTSAGTLLNPAKLSGFVQAFVSNTFTDNVTVNDLVNLAGSLGDLSPGAVNFYTMPTTPSTITSGGALEVAEPAASAMFRALQQDRPIPVVPSNKPASTAPAAESSRATTGSATPETHPVPTGGSHLRTSSPPASTASTVLTGVERVNGSSTQCVGPSRTAVIAGTVP